MFGRSKTPTPSEDAEDAGTEEDQGIVAAVSEIAASGFFDAAWYLARYPDVAAAGVDPVLHYVIAGAAEGRLPGPGFDPLWYLGESPEAGEGGANPLLHFLQIGRELGRTPRAASEGQAFDSFNAASRAGQLPFAGRLRAVVDQVHYALNPPQRTPGPAAMPLPPLEMAVRIGSPTLASFEEIGRGVKETIARCMPAGFEFRRSRCLDFGCGIGRVIRHFAYEAETAEFWGCDIDGTSIRWAVENLTPPFRFFQMSPLPSLPFEDSSFDLVYAIAVFSQVFDDWQHWAAEIRRVLKPGGCLFMSYAGQTPFEEMLALPYATFDPHPGLLVKNPFNSWNRGGPMVFMSRPWVERYWGSLFDIDFIAPDALLDYQSICVMRKPEWGSPPRMATRVVDVATRQAFNPDACGKIFARFDASRPFLDSYGIEAAGMTDVAGWIVLRGDEPARADLAVDDVPVTGAAVAWSPGDRYRDWDDTRQTAFRTRFDARQVSKGHHRLSVRITGRRGVAHEMTIPLKVQ